VASISLDDLNLCTAHLELTLDDIDATPSAVAMALARYVAALVRLGEASPGIRITPAGQAATKRIFAQAERELRDLHESFTGRAMTIGAVAAECLVAFGALHPDERRNLDQQHFAARRGEARIYAELLRGWGASQAEAAKRAADELDAFDAGRASGKVLVFSDYRSTGEARLWA